MHASDFAQKMLSCTLLLGDLHAYEFLQFPNCKDSFSEFFENHFTLAVKMSENLDEKDQKTLEH